MDLTIWCTRIGPYDGTIPAGCVRSLDDLDFRFELLARRALELFITLMQNAHGLIEVDLMMPTSNVEGEKLGSAYTYLRLIRGFRLLAAAGVVKISEEGKVRLTPAGTRLIRR
jgi:hypothetical protein